MVINPDFYLGKDSIGKPFPITGNTEKDVLIMVAMHELWHGTMEESLHSHEAKTLRGEKSEVQDIIDLIDDVIEEARGAAEGTKFSQLFAGRSAKARREILNRAWNRRDFAEFLASVKVSKGLQDRVDHQGWVHQYTTGCALWRIPKATKCFRYRYRRHGSQSIT